MKEMYSEEGMNRKGFMELEQLNEGLSPQDIEMRDEDSTKTKLLIYWFWLFFLSKMCLDKTATD